MPDTQNLGRTATGTLSTKEGFTNRLILPDATTISHIDSEVRSMYLVAAAINETSWVVAI